MSTKLLQAVAPTSFDFSAPRRRGGRTKRTYRCRHCSRIFKRNEHCARHERVHTQERPFPCGFCERKYARKDLVKRHERTLHVDEYKAAHPEEFRSDDDSSVRQARTGKSDVEWRAPPARKDSAVVPETSFDDYRSIDPSLLPAYGVLDRRVSESTGGTEALAEDPINQLQPYALQSAAPGPLQEYGAPNLDWYDAMQSGGNLPYHEVSHSTEPQMQHVTHSQQIEIDPLLLESAPSPWLPQSSDLNEQDLYAEPRQSVHGHMSSF